MSKSKDEENKGALFLKGNAGYFLCGGLASLGMVYNIFAEIKYFLIIYLQGNVCLIKEQPTSCQVAIFNEFSSMIIVIFALVVCLFCYKRCRRSKV